MRNPHIDQAGVRRFMAAKIADIAPNLKLLDTA